MIEFIRIEKSFDDAKAYRYGGYEYPNYVPYSGIQMLPNKLYPFSQRTMHKTGIEIEVAEVYVIDLCGNELFDATDYFNVDRVFSDLKGIPQIEWSITNIPFDSYGNLVCLRIRQGFNEFFYTSPFNLSSENENRVTVIHYGFNEIDDLMSVGINMYYTDTGVQHELSPYVSTSGKSLVTNSTVTDFDRYRTEPMDKQIAVLLSKLALCRILYIDLVRASFYEAIDVPAQGEPNGLKVIDMSFTKYKDDIYDPFYVPPLPPTPPTPTQLIILDNVQRVNNGQVRMFFHFENFTPNSVAFQISLTPDNLPEDDDNWFLDSSGTTISPRLYNVPNNNLTPYYYRVIDFTTNIRSDVFQIEEREILITGLILDPTYYDPEGFNQAFIYYTITGNIVDSTSNLRVQGQRSNETGDVWTTFNSIGPAGQKFFTISPQPVARFSKFRILDLTTGIKSNVQPYVYTPAP